MDKQMNGGRAGGQKDGWMDEGINGWMVMNKGQIGNEGEKDG